MNGPATLAELQRAYERSTLPAMGMTFDEAERSPAHAALLRAMVHGRRQALRDLAHRAERMRAGRWLALASADLPGSSS